MVPVVTKDKDKRFICLCNGVTQQRVEDAIASGCKSLGRIFDTTTAGVGACGGSCQPTLKKMLETYQETGHFPENPRHPNVKRERTQGRNRAAKSVK